jgi:type III restriction enzyme
MILKPFQEKAILDLKKKVIHLWEMGDSFSITFKAPTGAGKTVMMAQFLKDFVCDPKMVYEDIAFVWITQTETLANQSKEKIEKYYGGSGEITCQTLAHIQTGELKKNTVLFINWEKLVSSKASKKKLRTETEQGYTFDQYMENAHAKGRNIVLVIDEEHIASKTVLAEDVKKVIRPRCVIAVSATPTDAQFKVEVPRESVVEEGLIKESVQFQSKEELDGVYGKTETEKLLYLAHAKRNEIQEAYRELGVDINPLVLIQLPSDDSEVQNTGVETQRMQVLKALEDLGIKEQEIATWLSKEKIRLGGIEKIDSQISYLLFKQAVATGWDCPRAGVLVMFREVKNPSFGIQTIGRILRMPQGVHYTNSLLNKGYIYTNYEKNILLAEYTKTKDANNPLVYKTVPRAGVVPVSLLSTTMSRVDYNDLGDTFQETFKKVADKYFSISNSYSQDSFLAKGFDVYARMEKSIIRDVEIQDFDLFRKEYFKDAEVYQSEFSLYDVERIYNLLCYRIIATQDDERAKYAPERSWGKLKTALNVYFSQLALYTEDREAMYHALVRDLLKEDTSHLKLVIHTALVAYREVRNKEVGEKEQRKENQVTATVPPPEEWYPATYAEFPAQKSAQYPCYLPSGDTAVKNEMRFIEYIDARPDVLWWYKSKDKGSEYYAVPYINTHGSKALFYPDFFIQTTKGLYIVDTKDGITLRDPETKLKLKALQEYLKTHATKELPLHGGIITHTESRGWTLCTNHEHMEDMDVWERW